MSSPLDDLPEEERKHLKKRSQPSKADPMLATLTHDRFSDDNWIFERKLDGERALAFGKRGRVQLISRSQKELNVHYPEVEDALARQDTDHFTVDGEIVAFEGSVTSFSRLQGRMHVNDQEAARRTAIAVLTCPRKWYQHLC